MKRLSGRFLCQIFCQIFSHSARRTSKIRKRPPILISSLLCACSILRRTPGKVGSDGQALAALSTASIDDLAAVLGAHAGQKAMNFLAMTLLGLKSSLHGCILRKNSSPVMGYFWSQIGDRLAIQQYIAHYPLLSSVFFTFQQTFFKFPCEKAFNFFTGSPWKTFLLPYLVAKNRLGHKSREGTMERLFLCIINYIIEYRRREIFVVY